MREKIEYWLVLSVVRFLGHMPRPCARLASGLLAGAVFRLFGRLRHVGLRNLELVLPELAPRERRRILKGVFRHLGWQLVEFCRMTRYSRENTRQWIRTEGLQH
ncbi:MAG TPA: lipid A biosynthesis acyltransferase, partial [Terracidiphilus sp.]|nr:lipid A biosynthesis acyltransferase [Terracidiphilus sp.]